MNLCLPRPIFSLLFLICAALLSYGYYLQYVEGLQPCNLCIFERVCFAAVALLSLVGLIHGNKTSASRVYFALTGLASLIGAGIASRHVWIQNLPADQVPECGPGLDYLMMAFPLQDVIQTVLKGSGDCAKVAWQFLGLTIPGWALVCFVLFFLLSLAGVFGYFRDRDQ